MNRLEQASAFVSQRKSLWLRILLTGVALYIIWQVTLFVLLVLSAENRPFLLRAVLQSIEIILVLILVKRIVRPGPIAPELFERRYLLATWVLFGMWLCVMVPLGFEIRDPYLYGSANFEPYKHLVIPMITGFRGYLLAVWLMCGAATLVLYGVKKRWADVDEVLLPIVCHLIYTGILVLVRLGPDRAKTAMIGWNQAVFFLIGAIAFGIVVSPAVRERVMNFADRYPYIVLLITIALIGGTFFFGTALSGGRKLWYRLGPLTIQPIEISKILFVYVVAAFLEKKAYSFQKSRRLSSLVSLAVMCFSLFLVLLLQKDLGPIMVLVLVCLWMFVSVSGRLDLLAGAFGAIGLVVFLAFWFKQPSMVYHRIMDFVDPLQYSSQMTYALWTQASGDLWGTALGMSRAYKVPVIESDYIFTAVLAEKGWLGAATLLVAFWAFSIRGIQLARFLVKGHSRDATFMMGVVMVLFVQQVVIVAGNLNLLPLSGLTLPFVSAGGSSLVVNLGVLALMLGLVARHTRPAQVTATGQVMSLPMPIAMEAPTVSGQPDFSQLEPVFGQSALNDELVLGGRAFRAGSTTEPGGVS